MKKKLLLLGLAIAASTLGYAQAEGGSILVNSTDSVKDDEFTFNESQLGEDEDVTSDVIHVSSSSNVYTNQIGYTWGGSMRFRFRGLDSRYSDVYMNGVQVNNGENGIFSFSTIGGMNDAVRNRDASNPFEFNSYSMSNIGGNSNYDLRAADMASGHKVTLSGCNRNYTLRAMYTFGSGMTKNGWAFFGTVGYRWANMKTAAVDGTFYNSLSYFLAVQKVFNEHHSLSLSTWGSPTERATASANTDEAYWLANDYQYNSNWGWQNGEKRASRIVNNFEPSALLTWDFKINDDMKLTTSAFFKYAMYSSSKLNYNDAQNPSPVYWKNFPSAYYDVWDPSNELNWSEGLNQWQAAYNRWTTDPAYRQINWDQLYQKNQGANTLGKDAAYFILNRHNDHMAINLGSTFDWNINKERKLKVGIQLLSNKGMHYQTIGDMMGATNLHNINNYGIGTYLAGSEEVRYDLRDGNKAIGEGDEYGYDYNIWSQQAKLWAGYSLDRGIAHSFILAKIGGSQMWREGKMQNGLWKDNSYGRSDIGYFLDGGFKMGSTLNLGKGNAITFGVGYEVNAPKAKFAFLDPEQNNYFANNLKNEKMFSADLGWAWNCKWIQLNLNGYFYHVYDATDFQNFYDDIDNSFTYNNVTGITKNYYGAELGAKIKVTSSFDIVLLGTYGEAQYADNVQVVTTKSTTGEVTGPDVCYMKDMREGGTPLAAASVGLNYRINGWYLSLIGNYYDRIYLSPSVSTRCEANLKAVGAVNPDGTYAVPEQAKGNGGFMLDASIGHQFKIAKHPLSVNLALCNITNNRKMVTGGFEQSRSNYSMQKNGSLGSERLYDFTMNPLKYYAQGFNFMLNINYRF